MGEVDLNYDDYDDLKKKKCICFCLGGGERRRKRGGFGVVKFCLIIKQWSNL